MKSTSSFDAFAARLREFIRAATESSHSPGAGRASSAAAPCSDHEQSFSRLARELFELQFEHNCAYRRFCEARHVTLRNFQHWTQIPPAPTLAFKELDLTCLPKTERKTVFYSSGTTIHRPSRHFHNATSLALYEDSLWTWFQAHFQFPGSEWRLALLTPPPIEAPHSSLVHMFEVIRCRLGCPTKFFGKVLNGGAWGLNLESLIAFLNDSTRSEQPVLLCGTAFSYVNLLDHLAEAGSCFSLPPGSCVLETGGYKGRSRSLPRTELYSLVTDRLGIPPTYIVSEYGMSELSSQAYDHALSEKCRHSSGEVTVEAEWQTPGDEAVVRRSTTSRASRHASLPPSPITRYFSFAPWARVQIVSPETGAELKDGEIGLIRVFDLANVYSVMAIQTEDLGIRRRAGFELIGRVPQAEARGCSLMASA
jgi:hypothetical protein